MSDARINIFNKQDAILAETQATITTSLSSLANSVEELPPEVKLTVLSVVAQLAACSESIGELREATVDLNDAQVRNTRVNFITGMNECEKTQLRIAAQKEGFFGSLSDYVAKK